MIEIFDLSVLLLFGLFIFRPLTTAGFQVIFHRQQCFDIFVLNSCLISKQFNLRMCCLKIYVLHFGCSKIQTQGCLFRVLLFARWNEKISISTKLAVPGIEPATFCLEIMTRTIDQKLTFSPTVIMARRLMALVCSYTIGYTFANNKMTGSISCTMVFTSKGLVLTLATLPLNMRHNTAYFAPCCSNGLAYLLWQRPPLAAF